MEIINPNETKRELERMFTEGLGRTLSPYEHEILADIVAYPDEKRISFLEMMKELLNKHARIS
ncbi:hypothetical protein ACN6MY_08780 [Peribacillus sp. B-H-3]|uniref:hypothetical protein n=1 Tax=Peribacillus sp. B-H-3 TaxID=3400420 RepID=UPI003B015B55